MIRNNGPEKTSSWSDWSICQEYPERRHGRASTYPFIDSKLDWVQFSGSSQVVHSEEKVGFKPYMMVREMESEMLAGKRGNQKVWYKVLLKWLLMMLFLILSNPPGQFFLFPMSSKLGRARVLILLQILHTHPSHRICRYHRCMYKKRNPTWMWMWNSPVMRFDIAHSPTGHLPRAPLLNSDFCCSSITKLPYYSWRNRLFFGPISSLHLLTASDLGYLWCRWESKCLKTSFHPRVPSLFLVSCWSSGCAGVLEAGWLTSCPVMFPLTTSWSVMCWRVL